MRALMLALVVAACSGPPAATVPWESDLPEGGIVIYHADHGLGICSGFNSCPTRIVQVGGTCITETYRSGWEFRESEACSR